MSAALTCSRCPSAIERGRVQLQTRRKPVGRRSRSASRRAGASVLDDILTPTTAQPALLPTTALAVISVFRYDVRDASAAVSPTRTPTCALQLPSAFRPVQPGIPVHAMLRAEAAGFEASVSPSGPLSLAPIPRATQSGNRAAVGNPVSSLPAPLPATDDPGSCVRPPVSASGAASSSSAIPYPMRQPRSPH
ncbi:hypothetical protein B0J12DRAFT_765223 [Macrophomina phaseolina]|uniref:Uncharacterized protein n=1 Tax=Macrophomina phaseolina TaxID=35725 RepID=A0ABQ8FZ39_9PEZI|nr:hypothetical protein B0J12DRAFT_765223 [Macrophomina phaseolina]